MPLFGPPDIEKLKAKRDVAGLVKVLNDRSDLMRRRAAALALGEVRDPRALEPLIACLGRGYDDVGVDAARALGSIGDPRAIGPLIATLGHRDEFIRHAAAFGLGTMGEPAVEPVAAVLGDPTQSEQARVTAAEALGRSGGDRAVDSLIGALRDPSESVRFSAANALGQIGDAKAVSPLFFALGDGEGGVVIAAAQSLGMIGEPAVEALLQALESENVRLRGLAAKALGRSGNTRAVEPLIRLLRDKEVTEVGWPAAHSLGEIGDPRAVEPLLGVIHGSVRPQALWALGKLGDPRAISALILALSDTKPENLFQAAQALGRIGDVRAVGPLCAHLSGDQGTPVSKKAAAEALVSLYKSADLSALDRDRLIRLRGAIVAADVAFPT